MSALQKPSRKIDSRRRGVERDVSESQCLTLKIANYPRAHHGWLPLQTLLVFQSLRHHRRWSPTLNVRPSRHLSATVRHFQCQWSGSSRGSASPPNVYHPPRSTRDKSPWRRRIPIHGKTYAPLRPRADHAFLSLVEIYRPTKNRTVEENNSTHTEDNEARVKDMNGHAIHPPYSRQQTKKQNKSSGRRIRDRQ